MVPREAGRGSSFKGAGAYYLHDKDASTSERVAFTHTENVPTNDPQKALKWMAWTAIHAEDLKRESGVKDTGRPCNKPVFTFSLSWHPEQQPNKWEMVGAGRRALIALGLEQHETVMVAHNDRDHPHLHIIVNVVDPETGKANRVPFSKKKLSLWAEDYEREHGKIYCEQRVENNAKRTQAKLDRDELDLPSKITEIYHRSDGADSFRAALAEQGLILAKGKRLLVVDSQGKVYSLSRQIEGVGSKDIEKRLKGLELPDVDRVRDQIRKESERNVRPDPEEQYFDRDQQDRDWQESIIDAAIAAAEKPNQKETPASSFSAPPSHLLNRLQDRHLAELGSFYENKNRARLQLAARLDQQYGEQERDLRQRTERLETILKNSGRGRLLWLRFTGQISSSAKQDLEAMRLTLQNIEWRKREAEQSFAAENNRRALEIEARHTRERLALQPHADGPARATEQSGTVHDNDREHDDDFGPSFEY